MGNLFKLSALKITLIYLILGLIWIALSDSTVSIMFDDPDTITFIQTTKGWLYVSITALCLFVLLNKFKKDLEASREDALKALMRFRNVFENSTEGMLVLNDRGQILDSNPASSAILGYTPGELSEMNISRITADKYLETTDVTHVSNHTRFSGEIEFLHKKNFRIPVELTYTRYKITDNQKQTGLMFKDISERVEADKKLKDSLREKEVLLAEIHHRVKNNLAVISSLLLLQAEKINKEDRDVFYISVQRVKSIALIHEMLYQSDNLASLRFGFYIRKLCDSISDTYSLQVRNLDIEFDLEDDILLNINQAIPAGLIVSELIINAIKHAYLVEEQGTIHISMNRKNKNYVLVVSDSGKGLPDNFSIEDTSTLGFSLIRGLAEQINGYITVNSDNGTRVELHIPEAVSES